MNPGLIFSKVGTDLVFNVNRHEQCDNSLHLPIHLQSNPLTME